MLWYVAKAYMLSVHEYMPVGVHLYTTLIAIHSIQVLSLHAAETPTLPLWAGDLPLLGEFSKISRSPAWVWFSPAQVVLNKK